jgi:3',5'-nucleoside bisphosphate phosphatase
MQPRSIPWKDRLCFGGKSIIIGYEPMKTTEFARQIGRTVPTRRDGVDLHMHSTFSDGALPVKDLIDLCAAQGLAAISITDHDNIDSYEEGREYAREVGMELLPGVEISSWLDGSDIHILGYLFDPTHLKLNRILVELRERRRERAHEIVRRLNAQGIEIKIDSIWAKSTHGCVGRAHIATQLLEEEYVSSFQEAFNLYLGNGSAVMADIENAKLTPSEAIRLILDAGGVPVLAHPGKTCRDDLITHLVQAGLMGIEVYGHGNSHATFQRYKDIARRYDLLHCGGADFHIKREDGRHVPGSAKVPYSVIEKMRGRHSHRSNHH